MYCGQSQPPTTGNSARTSDSRSSSGSNVADAIRSTSDSFSRMVGTIAQLHATTPAARRVRVQQPVVVANVCGNYPGRKRVTFGFHAMTAITPWNWENRTDIWNKLVWQVDLKSRRRSEYSRDDSAFSFYWGLVGGYRESADQWFGGTVGIAQFLGGRTPDGGRAGLHLGEGFEFTPDQDIGVMGSVQVMLSLQAPGGPVFAFGGEWNFPFHEPTVAFRIGGQVL